MTFDKLIEQVKKTDLSSWCLGLSFVFYPFSTAISNLVLIPAFVFVLFNLKTSFNLVFKRLEYRLIFGLIIYLFVKAFIFDSFTSDFSYYKKYFYLLFIPLLVVNIKSSQIIYRLFTLYCLLLIIWSGINLFYFYSAYHYMPFNTGWTTNFVLVVERPYFGCSLLIASLLSMDQLHKKFRWADLILFFIFASALLIVSIRASLISLLVCSSVYLFIYSKISKRSKVLISIGSIVLIFLYVSLNKNLHERFFLSASLNSSYAQFRENEPRFEIYSCIKDMINENQFSSVFGFKSYTNIYEKLTNCYAYKIDNLDKKKYFINTQFNSHNQILDFYLIGGLIAFSLITSFFFFSLVTNIKNPLNFCILLSICFLMLVENMLFRQLGCLLFAVFTSLPFKLENEKEN